MSNSENSFHSALTLNSLGLLKKAIKNDISEINSPDQNLGWSPLYRAVLYSDLTMITILLENGANPNQFNKV